MSASDRLWAKTDFGHTLLRFARRRQRNATLRPAAEGSCGRVPCKAQLIAIRNGEVCKALELLEAKKRCVCVLVSEKCGAGKRGQGWDGL